MPRKSLSSSTVDGGGDSATAEFLDSDDRILCLLTTTPTNSRLAHHHRDLPKFTESPADCRREYHLHEGKMFVEILLVDQNVM